MLVKEIKETWKTYSLDRGQTHMLYDPKEGSGKYTVRKYLCDIEKVKRGWYRIINRGSEKTFGMVDNITALIQQVEVYVESLPYNSEFYNPTYRKGYFEEAVINDYLRQIGFDYGDCWDNSKTYVLKRKNIYGGDRGEIALTIRGLDAFNGVKENVEFLLWTSNYSWVSVRCKRECSEMIKTIDNILKPLLLTNSIEDFKKQEPLTIENFENLMQNVVRGLNIQSKDYKEELIGTLEKTLEQLKA